MPKRGHDDNSAPIPTSRTGSNRVHHGVDEHEADSDGIELELDDPFAESSSSEGEQEEEEEDSSPSARCRSTRKDLMQAVLRRWASSADNDQGQDLLLLKAGCIACDQIRGCSCTVQCNCLSMKRSAQERSSFPFVRFGIMTAAAQAQWSYRSFRAAVCARKLAQTQTLFIRQLAIAANFLAHDGQVHWTKFAERYCPNLRELRCRHLVEVMVEDPRFENSNFGT